MSDPAREADLYGDKDEIAAAELASLKPGARVYEKKSDLFFLSSKEEALEHLAAKKAAKEELKKMITAPPAEENN